MFRGSRTSPPPRPPSITTIRGNDEIGIELTIIVVFRSCHPQKTTVTGSSTRRPTGSFGSHDRLFKDTWDCMRRKRWETRGMSQEKEDPKKGTGSFSLLR